MLDEVWGEEIIVDERTIDVHMSWLRGKLRDAGITCEMIKTVYGSGYRFVVSFEADEENGAGAAQPEGRAG